MKALIALSVMFVGWIAGIVAMVVSVVSVSNMEKVTDSNVAAFLIALWIWACLKADFPQIMKWGRS